MLLRFILVSLIICCALITSPVSSSKLRVIFFGDSITERGATGSGYIQKINLFIFQKKLTEKYELIGAGRGGNKISDLLFRIDEDVVAKYPNVVVIYVGLNDIWQNQKAGSLTEFEEFKESYKKLINKLRDRGIQIVICTPTVIGEKNDSTNKFDIELNLYSDWLVTYALTENIPLVNLRQSFLNYLSKNNPENKVSGILTTDMVHLNQRGNDLVAEEVWKVLQKL